MIETRDEHWGRIALLLAAAALVWWFNARQLIDGAEEQRAAPADVAQTAAIDIHERTQILRPVAAAEALPLTWDPFARRPLGEIKEPDPPQAETPPTPPPPVTPLGLEFIGLVESENRQIFILRSRAGLEFVALNDQVGPWRLAERRDDRLVFQDEEGRTQELPIGAE